MAEQSHAESTDKTPEMYYKKHPKTRETDIPASSEYGSKLLKNRNDSPMASFIIFFTTSSS